MPFFFVLNSLFERHFNKIRFSQTDCVADFVKGNIDMATMERKNTFPLHRVRTYSCTKDYNITFWSIYFGKTLFIHLLKVGMFWQHMYVLFELEYEMHIKVFVKTIEDELLRWKIPCFPVMEVEFRCAWAIINGQQQKILLSKESPRLKCPANVRSTTHCIVTIHSEIILLCAISKEIQQFLNTVNQNNYI